MNVFRTSARGSIVGRMRHFFLLASKKELITFFFLLLFLPSAAAIVVVAAAVVAAKATDATVAQWADSVKSCTARGCRNVIMGSLEDREKGTDNVGTLHYTVLCTIHIRISRRILHLTELH